MQQSFAYQVLASTITNADGSAIKPSVGDNTWNIGPDAVNGQTGFKHFDQIDLSKGDVLNFIYSYINQSGINVDWNADNKTHSAHLTPDAQAKAINTFIALVNQGVNVNGIVNALQSAGGPLKSDGNLMIISPGGLVVGASGVLNVGSLSVISPTQTSYDSLTKYLNLPTTQEGRLTGVTINENDPPTEGKYTLNKEYSDSVFVANNTDKTFNTSTLTAGDGSVLTLKNGSEVGGPITINGADSTGKGGLIAARGDVNLQGGQVNVNGLVVAGLGTGYKSQTSDILTGHTAANTLFDTLVNTDNMASGSQFVNNNGNISIKSVTGTSVANGAAVKNFGKGDITIENSGASGINIAGGVSNPNGKLTVTNTGGKLLVASTGLIESGAKNNNANSNLLVSNTSTGGMDIQGQININHGNQTNTVQFTNKNSDMKIGYAGKSNNIQSNADVNIDVTGGDLLNNGVSNVLINTTNGADLNINVTNGSIGTDLGNQDGHYTGIWKAQRDLEKSLNIAVDGVVTAKSTGTNSSANIASIGKNLKVNTISSQGRTTVLADSASSGNTDYDIINASTNSNTPNIEGKGVSLIASGNIGSADNALTFRQTQGSYGSVNGQLNYTDNASYGTDMLAIGDINVKGMDSASGQKLDTNVGALISREGSVNAEFSGDTYIRETTADGTINITTRGKNLYVEHLGEAPSYGTYTEDYFGPNNNAHPTSAKLTALDLGTDWNNRADSTIIVKNGTLQGKGEGRPAHEQDLTLVADNAYAGGYHFHMGNDRGEIENSNPSNPSGHKFNPSYFEEDSRTNKITNATDSSKPVSIRAKAVRPEDVTAIGKEEDERNYYYGGSSQGFDDGYDGVKDEDGDYVDTPTYDEQGDENDDDNLVVPEDKEDVVDTDNDSDSDNDTDADNDTDNDADNDIDSDSDTDSDNDSDDDLDSDTDNDTDADSDTDADNDNDSDSDSDTDNDTDADNDTDNDADNDIDSDSDTDSDNDSDDDLDSDTDNDTDADSDTDADNDNDSDSDSDTDNDTDADNDTDNDADNDIDSDSDTDSDNDSDDDLDSDTDNDTDADSDTDADNDNDSDSDSDSDNDTDADNDTDNDADNDIDSDSDTDSDNDSDDDLDSDTDNDTDTDTDTDVDSDTDEELPVIPNLNYGAYAYKQRVVSDRVDSIDKRQFMRFDAENNQNLITFESTDDVIAISDISRGGVSLKHNKKLKVGDIVPVHLTYGDLEINANVKIVSASDVKAGGQFIDLDQATANKLLYLSLIEKDQPIVQTIQNISTTTIDE